MNMGVGVDMLVRVGMHQVTMLMRVVVDVGMLRLYRYARCLLGVALYRPCGVCFS